MAIHPKAMPEPEPAPLTDQEHYDVQGIDVTKLLSAERLGELVWLAEHGYPAAAVFAAVREGVYAHTKGRKIGKATRR